MLTLVLAIRGFVAIVLLVQAVGGLPRTVQLGLGVVVGLATSALIEPPALGLGPTYALLPASARVLALVPVAVREAAIGATLGIVAALPLLIAQTAGRLVDRAGSARGSYAALFGLLAAAVFVGIDGHVTVIRALVDSYRDVPALGDVQPRVVGALAALIGGAVTLAIPWLVTAAVVEVAVGVGMRLAARAGSHVPTAVAVPAALVMITATLISTLAVTIAAITRASL